MSYSARPAPAEVLLLITSKIAQLTRAVRKEVQGCSLSQPQWSPQLAALVLSQAHLPACAPIPRLHPNECREGEMAVLV